MPIKNILLGLMPALLCAGCVSGLVGQQVDFVYFNLAANRITVLDITGIPPDAVPGVLAPVHDENNRLEEVSSTFFEVVHVKDRIKITWKEANAAHALELKRDDWGIPEKLKSGKIRFTFLGNDKWRIKFFP